MAKAFGKRIAYPDYTGHLLRWYSNVAAIRSWINRIAGDPGSVLADRFMKIWEVFRQKLAVEDPVSTDRTGNPRAFAETRDRAYLDIHRNIR